jgi:hypothetical protein
LIAADEFKQVQLLKRHRALVLTPEFRAALRALAVLRPDVPLAQELLGILNEVSDSDLDIVLARHLDNLNRRAVFAGWVATATWDGSKTYFMQHREALIDAKTRRIIGIGADATERQHLAILDLVASSSDESAYEIVSNVGVAADAAVDAIEAGDLTRLEAILTAADVLDTKPDTWNLAMAVLHASRNDLEQAQLAINRVAARATPIQRRAHSVRLRALLAGNPNLTELAQLIDMIEGMPS